VANVTIIKERVVQAPVEELWPHVDHLDKLAEWFEAAERAEVLEGEGAGRRQQMVGRWGGKAFEIDQVVTAHQPPYLIAWEHEAERLDGKSAPKFARTTRFEIRLIPRPEGAMVRMESSQEPAGPLKGMALRLAGKRQVAKQMQKSLQNLAARF
jgi:uncharacterized protein YndB with AHSA1/START domain